MREIVKRLLQFGSVSLLLAAGSCVGTTSFTETSLALCQSWGSGLFRPSRADTEETAIGLTRQYADHSALCP